MSLPNSPARERLLDALTAAGCSPRHNSAKCPAHDDNAPSLSFGDRADGDGVVIRCHAGCDTEDILTALRLGKADLFDTPRKTGPRRIVATYDYCDEHGTMLFQKVRLDPKDFRQRHMAGREWVWNLNGTRRVLYRLPELATTTGTVYLAEGEKDADALARAGVTVTTWTEGAWKPEQKPKWRREYTDTLKGRHVVIVRDRDEPGRHTAATIAGLLDGTAASVRIVEPAEGKDAADHLAAGHELADLVPVSDTSDTSDVPLPARRARITWASEIDPEPVVWAWAPGAEGRIPAGSLSVAAGREGTGKSSFGIWLAAQLTRGTLPGSFYGTPRRVFYCAVEDSWKHTLVPRLIAAGADRSMVGRFDVIGDGDEELALSLPHDNALLEAAARDHGAALVVIDPLMSVIGAKIDTHREREVRLALDPLAKLADRTGAVVLGIAHFNKGSGTDAASLITGSGAFKNVPRSVFGFARDEADEEGGRVMSQVKNSLGRDDLPSFTYVIEGAEVDTKKGPATTGRFAFTGESDRSVADVLRDSRHDPEDADERRDAAGWIEGYLENAGGSAPAKDVLTAGKAAGFSESTLKNARKKVAGTERRGFEKGAAWAWVLRVGTPVGPVGTRDQKVVPTGPTAVPTEDRTACTVCGFPLPAALADAGETTHPTCEDA